MTNFICCQYLNITARNGEHTEVSTDVVQTAAARGTANSVAR